MAIHKAVKRTILMLCGLLVCAGTLQAATPAQSSDAKASHGAVDQAAEEKTPAAADLHPGQLLIPANGHCLYTTIIMGYLLPVRQEADNLATRVAQLFGHPPADYLNRLDQTLQNPTEYLIYLHAKEFGFLVNTFMSRMQIAKGTWGGPAEIQTIATKLTVNIQAYYPDPSNPTHLVQSDLTQPAQGDADSTIHIVRDRVDPAEVLTQAEKESAADNPHYQHYRLKYTLAHGTASSIHLDEHIVDSTTSKKESTAARSTDMARFPAPTGQATGQGDGVEDLQMVSFTPAAAPLIISKGTTHILPVQAVPYEFSYIKIEESATLTIDPWQPNQKSGGKLSIHCYGDCMLGKNAKINVSAKGYSGSTSPIYHGHGPRGGASGIYCAAGGSNSTAGGSGQCRDAFIKATTYHASSQAAAGQVLLTKATLMCGSGGGYLYYPNSSDTSLSPRANGTSGGGALYLQIDGYLQLAENTAFLANGGEATPLTGGAGSGGSICLALKGQVTFTSPTAQLCAKAQGGSNQKAIHPTAQGAGGEGHITLYINPQNHHALKRMLTQPPALVLLSTQVKQRKIYRDDLVDHYLIAKGISSATVKRFWEWLEAEEMEEDAIMEDMEAATPSQSNIYQFDKAVFQSLKRLMTFLAPHQLPNMSTAIPVPSAPTTIPDHVTIAGKCYNAQGVAHAEKADYPQAARYHRAALALQTKQYADHPHPDKADTLLYQAKLAADQGHYAQAMEAGKAALDMRQTLYQAEAPAHTAIIETCNWLGWLDYQQGQTIQALQQLEETLALWKQHHPDQKEPVLIDTYNYIGLVQQRLGQYQKAIKAYHSEAQAIAQSGSGVDHSLRATTLHYIGQAHTQLGQYAQAIDAYHEEMRLLAELHGQDNPHPDRAAAFSGIAYTHAAQGHYPLATFFHQKSYHMHQAIYGQQARHPAIADNLDNLGDLALQQQATSEAMRHYQGAYEMKIALYGEKEAHVAIALSHANIGRAHLQADQPQKALAAQEKALAIATAVYGEEVHMPIIGRLTREMGLVYLPLDDYHNAQKALQISLKIYTNLFGDQPHPDTAHTHYALGESYLAQSRYKQALDHTSKALHIRQAVYQSVSHHPTITAALLQLGRIYATQAQYDRAIHCYALATRCQVDHLGAVSDLGQNLARFVPTNASLQKTLAQEEQPLPLHEKSIMPFLHQSPAQVLLLHGDAGAGKSLYGRFLEKALWEACPTTLEAMQTEAYTIPLFISLPALQDPTQNAISQALQQYGWDKATIAYFKQQLTKPISKPNHIDDDHKDASQDNDPSAPVVVEASCVIILDGYDEINNLDKPLNIYTAYQLDAWHAKVLVTCRTEHLARTPDHARYFAPNGKGLQKRYIRPFDLQQIDHYLDKIVQIAPASADDNASDAHNANHWTKEDYQKAFKEIPTLQELMKSPFLLCMITTILPKWQGKAHSTVTRTAVYRAFIHQWIEKALTRMYITGKAAKQKADAAKAYAAALGFALFLEEEQVFCTGSQDKAWQRFLADEDALTYLAILPIRKVGTHQYQFIHKSCQEFFAAQHIYDSLKQLHDSQKNLQAHFAQQVKPYQPTNREAAVQDTQTYRAYAISCPPINQKLLKTAPAIIAFLQDGFVGKQSATFQQWLFQVIKASTRNPKVAIAASNAITLLAGRISLGGQVWPNIQIPDAVLDRAFLAYTNLQGTNLNRVSFREAHLEGVKCQQAQVAGLRFGEYPYFEHERAVNSVSWSHDDRFLASASEDKSVRVWDAKTGRQVQICTGHDRSVNSVSWSHDDRFLASASWDKSVRVWNVKTGQQVQICTGHTDWVRSVSWSHDDLFLASASVDKSVRVWDAKTGQQVQICTGHDTAVRSVSWSHDDRFLASASADKSVRVWDAKTGQQVQICTGHDNYVRSVSWSHDDRLLASASRDTSVRIWDAKTGRQVLICRGHDSYATSVCWSHDNLFLASASADMTVRVWDAKTGRQVQMCTGHDNVVMSVSWSHDDRFLASGSFDMTVRIWDRYTGHDMQMCTRNDKTVTSVRWSHDDRFLASASSENSVRIWDAKSGQQVQMCTGHNRAVMSVSWSHDDRFLASASEDKSVRVWDTKTGEQVQICTGHDNYVWGVRWSHDDCFLASASLDMTVRVWNPKTGKQVQMCTGHDDAVYSVSWSHDGRYLASASKDKSVRVWEAKTGAQVQMCTGHDNYVMSVSWSHDDRFLASASGSPFESQDNSVRIWDSKTGEQVQICRGHDHAVWSVRWSHDDRFLASVSWDMTVRVWDAKTGEQVQMCTGHDNVVWSVSWSHDDRFLASAGADYTVRVWDTKTGEQVQICTGDLLSGVSSVRWSYDRRFLAAASDDNSVRVWDAQPDRQGQMCTGDDHAVNSMHRSHDDRVLTSESEDKHMRVWDAKSGGQVQMCTGHDKAVTSVSWSHDDRFLASASEDKTIRVWNVQTGEQVQMCTGHDKTVMSVSWSHDDRFLASASDDKTIRVWDAKSGAQVQMCTGHHDVVNSVSWSYDDHFLASASADKSVRIWDAKTGSQVQICTGQDNYVLSVSWSHDDRFLASASDDKSVRVWDAKTGEQVQICTGHDSSVFSVSWSHDDRFLASAGADMTVRVWDAKTGQQVQICTGHEDEVMSVSWSHDDRFLASASDDTTILVWNPKTGDQVQICKRHQDAVNSVSWSHSDLFFASASADKRVRVWVSKIRGQGQICTGHTDWVCSVSWSHDDRFLASASLDMTVRVWDAKTGEQVQICTGHTDWVSSVSWSHDDRFLASASADKSVRVWNPKTGEQVQMCTGHQDAVNSVSWSHDDRFLASASADKSVRIWDREIGWQLQICTGHDKNVHSVSWSHDDRFLASASADKTVRIWDRHTDQHVQICTGHTYWVQRVSWSRDDRFLASASDDNTVRVWDAKTGQQVQMYTGHDASAKHLVWLDHDQHLAAQSDDKSVHVCDKATSKHALPKACRPLLVIGRWHDLVLKEADFSGAVGLSAMNKQLISQKKGII